MKEKGPDPLPEDSIRISSLYITKLEIYIIRIAFTVTSKIWLRNCSNVGSLQASTRLA